jgi:hypothetical protein
MEIWMELRAVIHFLWVKHTPNRAIHSELQQVYRTNVITLGTIEK